MLKEKDAVVRRAMMVADGVIAFFSFFTAYFLRQYFHLFYKLDLFPSAELVSGSIAPIESYIGLAILIAPLWCVMLYFSKAYTSMRTKTSIDITWSVLKAALLMAVSFSVVVFLFKFTFVSRTFFIIFIAIGTFFLLVEKFIVFYFAHTARKKGYNYRRLIIVGTGARACNFIRMIHSHPEWGFKIRALLDYEKHLVGKYVEGVQITGTLDDLQDMLLDKTTDEVVFIVPRSALGKIERSLHICETVGIKATVEIDIFRLKIAKLRQTELEGIPLISFETITTDEISLFVKRAFDVVASFFGIIILSPVFLLVGALIKLTSRGSVFFIQRRMGLNGRKFALYKFRTMYKDAHRKRLDMEKHNESDGPVFKIKKDPRVTPLGKFLRKFSIDELPQLFNVFRGNMSLVGPRPPLPKEVVKYDPWQRRRLSMRPGLTCLWQINGRNKIGFAEWMELDLEYIDTWSLKSDFRILIKTIPVVILGTGC